MFIHLKTRFIELYNYCYMKPRAIIVIDLSLANMVMRSVSSGIPQKTDYRLSRKTPPTGICGQHCHPVNTVRYRKSNRKMLIVITLTTVVVCCLLLSVVVVETG